MPQRTIADFWFDPVCPWAWITSRWMREVEKVRPVDTRWHVMSLSMLNAGRDLSEDYARRMDEARGVVRVCTAAAAKYGEEVLGDLYTAQGTLFHVEQRPKDRETLVAALDMAQLPVELADAVDDPSFDEPLERSHHQAMAKVGTDVGTPVISVGEVAFFGPVVTPAPQGEAAGTLWDGVLAVARTDGFFELKRSRDRKPQVV
ncbi:MAG: disulfide bond formation protein DsbA [Actinomycetes bacterium]